MTKVRSPEECLAAVQADSAWRKKEITLLRQRVENANGDLEIIVRSSIVILYAHWEGFVRTSARLYIIHVNEMIARKSIIVNDHFSNLLMWKMFKQFGDHLFLKNPVPFLKMRAEWPCDSGETLPVEVVDTESNLNFKVLEKIEFIIGLSIDEFSSKENLIDERLLRSRNKIAHGERVVVDATEYKVMESEVLGLIDLFQSQLEICISKSSYMST